MLNVKVLKDLVTSHLTYFSSFMAIAWGSVSPSNSTITGAHILVTKDTKRHGSSFLHYAFIKHLSKCLHISIFQLCQTVLWNNPNNVVSTCYFQVLFNCYLFQSWSEIQFTIQHLEHLNAINTIFWGSLFKHYNCFGFQALAASNVNASDVLFQ